VQHALNAICQEMRFMPPAQEQLPIANSSLHHEQELSEPPMSHNANIGAGTHHDSSVLPRFDDSLFEPFPLDNMPHMHSAPPYHPPQPLTNLSASLGYMIPPSATRDEFTTMFADASATRSAVPYFDAMSEDLFTLLSHVPPGLE
jgi:hypothetical protein